MNLILRISILLILVLVSFPAWSYQQVQKHDRNLENFVFTTNQDFYLSGDRMWFAMKLLRDHEDYLYSKLAYLEIYGPDKDLIYSEKILLDPDRMAYGDLILPENALSGVYTMFIFSKWMSNFDNFPIAKKHFLVKNPTIDAEASKPELMLQIPPFRTAKLSFFHTSVESESMEIIDSNGNSIEVLEKVEGLKPYFSQVLLNQPMQILFRNEVFSIEPSLFWWDPVAFEIEKNKVDAKAHQIVTHTDWQIIERKRFGNQTAVTLDKELHKDLKSFKISILDGDGGLIWLYEHKQPITQTGNINYPNSSEVGSSLQVSFQGFDHQVEQASLWAKMPEPESVKNLFDILEDPNWIQLGNERKAKSLASALENQTKTDEKEYVPMLVYRPWNIKLIDLYPDILPSRGIDIDLSQEEFSNEIDRKIFHQHFGQEEQVSGLSSTFIPDITYVIDEYVPFENLEIFLKEIVVQTRFRKNRAKKTREIRILDTTDDRVNFKRIPIILVDFYEVQSLDALLSIELNQLDRIEVYYDRNTIDNTNLGESVGSGMIAFFTKNNDYALKNNLNSSQYFLKDVKVSRKPPKLKVPARFQKHAVNLYNPQFFDPKINFIRGRGRSNIPYFDYPEDLIIESWIFFNDRFDVLKRTIKVE